jgi:hypothetical protein
MKHAIRSVLLLVCVNLTALGQQPDVNTIKKSIGTLRQLPEGKRSAATRQLALSIRSLPPSRDKVVLADGLAHLATEGEEDVDVL